MTKSSHIKSNYTQRCRWKLWLRGPQCKLDFFYDVTLKAYARYVQANIPGLKVNQYHSMELFVDFKKPTTRMQILEICNINVHLVNSVSYWLEAEFLEDMYIQERYSPPDEFKKWHKYKSALSMKVPKQTQKKGSRLNEVKCVFKLLI